MPAKTQDNRGRQAETLGGVGGLGGLGRQPTMAHITIHGRRWRAASNSF